MQIWSAFFRDISKIVEKWPILQCYKYVSNVKYIVVFLVAHKKFKCTVNHFKDKIFQGF